jgi:hypothetical protein
MHFLIELDPKTKILYGFFIFSLCNADFVLLCQKNTKSPFYEENIFFLKQICMGKKNPEVHVDLRSEGIIQKKCHVKR